MPLLPNLWITSIGIDILAETRDFVRVLFLIRVFYDTNYYKMVHNVIVQ